MNEDRLRAVFLMLAGNSVADVSAEFKICLTSLYNLRRRARDAVRREIENTVKNKKPACNRIPQEKEDKIIRLCQRHTALSSYKISRKYQQLENETINPRTIQRIRKRYSLPRLPKRPTPTFKSHRFTNGESSSFGKQSKTKCF